MIITSMCTIIIMTIITATITHMTTIRMATRRTPGAMRTRRSRAS